MGKQLSISVEVLIVFLVVQAIGLASALAQTQWNPEEYAGLVQQSNALYDSAQELTETDAVRRSMLVECVDLKREAIEMLRDAIITGQVDEYLEAAVEELMINHQNMVVLLSDLGLCSDATARLDEAFDDAEQMVGDYVATLEPVRQRIADCVEATEEPVASTTGSEEHPTETIEQPPEPTTTSEPEPVAELTVEPTPVQTQPEISDPEQYQDVVSDDGVGSPLPYVLMVTGAALVAGGIGYDLSIAGDLDDFYAIQTACDAGTCTTEEHARGVELKSTVEDAQPAIGILIGTGVAAGIVGVILMLVEDEASVAITPQIRTDSAGGAISWQF